MNATNSINNSFIITVISVILSTNVVPINPQKYTIDIFDIRGKYYKDLPEFLQKRFDKFNINVTRFFDCTPKMIAYHLRNYNNHEAMSKNQYGVTCVANETTKKIKDISQKHTFMKNNNQFFQIFIIKIKGIKIII